MADMSGGPGLSVTMAELRRQESFGALQKMGPSATEGIFQAATAWKSWRWKPLVPM